MSTFTSTTTCAPRLAVVRTHGDLAGPAFDDDGEATPANIPEGARTAAQTVADIARSPHSVTAQSLAAEAVIRAEARSAKAPGKRTIASLARLNRGLKKAGLPEAAVIAAGALLR